MQQERLAGEQIDAQDNAGMRGTRSPALGGCRGLEEEDVLVHGGLHGKKWRGCCDA
jgi:hypothetical protein